METKRLNIGFDAKRIVSNATGLGSYGRTLINDLAKLSDHQLRLYAPTPGRDDLRLQVEEHPNLSFVYPRLLFNNRLWQKLRGSWWRSHGVVSDLKRDGIHIYHGLSGELPTGLRKAGICGIVTIHDLIFLRHPEFYNPVDVFLYRRKFQQTLKEAERIIAISECTKRDILAFGEFPEDRIDIIYQRCRTRFCMREPEQKLQEVNAQYDLPARYILNVGTIEVRKNVGLVVKALRHLPDDLHLVVLGRPTQYKETVLREAADSGVTHRLHFLHGIPNEDLPSIYQLAECFVYPSRYEGFGIPIIEAIQSGLPVVAATGSCLEEAGGPDSLYVSPDDAEGMAEAVVCAIKEREERVARSREYVRRFENSNVARQMLEEYQRYSTY